MTTFLYLKIFINNSLLCLFVTEEQGSREKKVVLVASHSATKKGFAKCHHVISWSLQKKYLPFLKKKKRTISRDASKIICFDVLPYYYNSLFIFSFSVLIQHLIFYTLCFLSVCMHLFCHMSFLLIFDYILWRE